MTSSWHPPEWDVPSPPPPPPSPAPAYGRLPSWPPAPQPSGIRIPVGGFVALVIGLLAVGGLVGAVVGAAIASIDDDLIGAGDFVYTYGAGGDLAAFELGIGECAGVDIAAVDAVRVSDEVPCAESHVIEVYSTFPLPAIEGTAVRDADELAEYADEGCYAAFEPYVGLSYEESVYDYAAVVPVRGSSDRPVHCVLFDLDGHVLEEPPRASRR